MAALQARAASARMGHDGTGSIQPEVVQEEVRRAVQQAMQQRDHRVSDLQAEKIKKDFQKLF